MEAKNIIFGSLALAVIGGGAYLFLKSKKSKDVLKLAELQKATGLSTETPTETPTGGTTSTPDKVLDSAPVTNAQAQAQETSNQIQAQGLASQIAVKRSMKKSGFNLTTIEKRTNTFLDIDIMGLSGKIKDLGYKEVNGVAVKL